jgi:long-chain acyl-CoA synthetase
MPAPALVLASEAVPSPEPLPLLFQRRARSRGDAVAGRCKVEGRWTAFTWSSSLQAVEETACGLIDLGIQRGDRVGIISQTRREWAVADMAILTAGAITVGVYPTLTAAQTRYVLEHSGCLVVFVEDADTLEKTRLALAGLSRPPKLVVLSGASPDPSTPTLAALQLRGGTRRALRPSELDGRRAQARPEDVATYVYTSGTTGEPKGAMLTHANFHYVVHASARILPYEGRTALAFLPLAHSLQRYASYLGLVADVDGYYAESLDTVAEDIRDVRPHCFATVPRILEKIRAKVLATGRDGSDLRRDVFERSLRVLGEYGAARRAGLVPGVRLAAKARVADRLVGGRIRERIGGRVEWLGCGGAPLDPAVHAFFEDLGIAILEGWGLTETSAPVCINTLDQRRIGSVGRPMPGSYVRLAEDGEIEVRGPGVFVGYYADEAATREAFTEDGWFKTGDVGVMSREGFLRITDRKKNLLITAGGKNVAPQPIEERLRADPLIGQAVVLGDRRPYLVAMIGLDEDARRGLCAEHGLPPETEVDRLAAEPSVRAALERRVAEVNAGLAGFEQIKRWAVLPEELTVEAGTLTPTLKVKRRAVETRYADRIEGLFDGPSGPAHPAS